MVKVLTGRHFVLTCTSSDCGLKILTDSWLGVYLVASIVDLDFDWHIKKFLEICSTKLQLHRFIQ